MSERFDDMIRKQLEGLESPVPPDMFDAIRRQPEVSVAMFDAGLKNKLQSAETPVAAGLFDKLNADADLSNAPFDETILQKVNGYESLVPADMWSRIMQEKHRRRPVAWWWVAAGFLLLLSGGTWYAVQHQHSQKAFTGKGIAAGKNNTPASPGSISVTREPALVPTADTAQGTISVIQIPFAPIQDGTAKTQSPANNDLINSEVRQRREQDKLKQQEQEFLHRPASATEKEDGYPVGKYNRIGVGKETDKGLVFNSSGDENVVQTEDVTAALITLRLSIMQQLRNAAKLVPGQLLKARSRLPVIPCPVLRNEGRNDWYADIYTSAFIVQRSISDKAAGKNAKNGFDSTLQGQVSLNAGINLVKNIGNHVLLKTGVQYNRTNESFRLTRINERKLVTTISIRTVIINPGDTVYIRDTSVTERIGTIQRRNQNTYQQWDVPVIVGYEFGGENIHLNANAGIIANIRSAYTGQMLDDSLQHVIDAKNYNGKSVYKTNIGFSLYAGLSIIKPLGERTSLLIEPYARIGLQNMTTESAWFRQKNSSAGVSIGLRYQLNTSGQRR